MPSSPDFLQRALDPTATTPDDPVSTRILDAALELAVESGMRNVTVDDVARRAGVGRVTVYRRFTDRATLVEQLFLRETRRSLSELRRAVDFRLPADQQIVEGFVTALRIARRHPLLARLLRLDPASVFATVGRVEVFSLLRSFMSMQLRAARYERRPEGGLEVDTVAEVVVRLGLSYVLLPDGLDRLEDDDDVRELARRTLLPVIDDSLRTAPSGARRR